MHLVIHYFKDDAKIQQFYDMCKYLRRFIPIYLSKCANAREHVRAFASLVAAKHVKRKQPNPFAYGVDARLGRV